MALHLPANRLLQGTCTGALPQVRPRVAAPSSRLPPRGSTIRARVSSWDETEQQISYGPDWYAQTREAMRPRRSEREELEYRREANFIANKGRDREDLYSANWEGDQWKGSPFNILNVIIALLILTPTAGLIFAYFTYGTLWGCGVY